MENSGPKLVMQVQWIETVYPVLAHVKGESISTRIVSRTHSRVRSIELIQDAYIVHLTNGEARLVHFPNVKESCAKLIMDETGENGPKEPPASRPLTKKAKKTAAKKKR